jgi:hypothetical protein
LSRIVISAVRVVGRLPHDRRAECRYVWAAFFGSKPVFGVGNGREDGTVPGKHLDQSLA